MPSLSRILGTTPGRRRLVRAAEAWSDGICTAGGAVATLLALARIMGPVAEAVAPRIARPASTAPRIEATIGFVLATAAAVLGAVAATGLSRAIARWGKPWGGRMPLAAVVLVVVAVLGAFRARWLGFAAPITVLAVVPWLTGGTARAVPATWRDPRSLAACLACEGACLGVGLWFPLSKTAPALLPLAMITPGALALYVAVARAPGLRGSSRSPEDLRWRLAVASLPMLALPLAGLVRNPTLLPAVSCVVVAAAGTALLGRFPAVAAPLTRWARVHAITLAIAAILLVLFLPWHFRDLPVADLAGHEGQHLGWINSISFGKLMMADAGFTYGPLREYLLALVAWLLGGLTLEHVRLAHLVVNIAGLLCLVIAMRRVSAGRLHLLVLGAALVLTHSALVSLVVYKTTYSFGWADTARAGLATLAVVVVLSRRREDGRSSRRRLLAGGALAGIATLYSHDYGVPAVAGTLVGLALEVLCVDGDRPTFRRRAVAALRGAGRYLLGFVAIVVPFLAYYAAHRKLGAFFDGYRWAIGVSNSTAPFAGRTWWVTSGHFASWDALTAPSDSDNTVGARVLDYVLGPGLVIMGLAHVAAAIARGRFAQRSALVAALAVVGGMTMHHAFLASDPWHMANASTPGLVMLVALAAGGRGLNVPLPRGRRAIPLGAMAAVVVPLVWLSTGAPSPVNDRLARIASGDERPSFGDKYKYDDLPRAGDLHIGDEHLNVVRWIRAHSAPDDPVLCATWLLGGGTEAFLSQRRNPTSFDKPDEVVSKALQARALAELKRDPPLLVVGDHLNEFGDEVRAFIAKGWSSPPPGSGAPGSPPVVVRNP
jgi:hypothetical protein